jgi:hypothetical protein
MGPMLRGFGGYVIEEVDPDEEPDWDR